MKAIWNVLVDAMHGETSLAFWLIMFVVAGIAAGIWSGFFKARKIQPKGFKWKIFRNEILFTVITIAISGTALGFINKGLTAAGIIAIRHEPAAWWMIAIEYVAYFFLFDTWFYWLHRWMHREPIYTWVHKLHHRSTSPNVITTFSVSPFESLVNGGFLPVFLSIVSIHDQTMALVLPTNIIMGIYVHTGYEFFPRWWNKSWATKWFITTTFHDQHHRYFTCNFGGYTTIWDRICGTMRPKFEADFDKIKARAGKQPEPAAASAPILENA